MKRAIFWIIILLMLAPLLFVGLTILANRLINQEAIKDRIETAVSRDLGGRLRYERVGLAILPRPHVVISDLSITVPGSVAVTSESLNVTFELLPLFVGKARIADVRLDHPDVTVTLGQERPAPEAGQSEPSDRNLGSMLGWLAATMPNLDIRIDEGQLVFIRQEQPVFALKDAAIRFAFSPPDPAPAGSGPANPVEPFRIIGSARGVVTKEGFPGPVKLRIGAFEVRPHTVSFTDSEARALDADGTVAGRIDDYLTTRPAADVVVAGSIGPEAMQWVRASASLPEEILLRTPVSIKSAHVVWTAAGAARVTVSATVQRDVSIAFNVQRTTNHFSIDELTVRDKDSQAVVTLDFRDRVLGFSFAGHLAHSTLTRVFEQQRVEFGSLKGDFRARIVLDRPRDFTAEGQLEGDRLVLPVKTRVPVFIDRVVTKAAKQIVAVDPLVLTLGDTRHTVRGQIAAAPDQWLLDLTVDHVNWADIEGLFGSDTISSDSTLEPPRDAKTRQPVRATIRVSAASFTAGGWTAEPARADITIGSEPPHITLHEALVCGITVAGTATIAEDATRIAITSAAKNQDLEPTLTCLVGKPMRVSGTFDLSGKLDSTGTGKALVDNLGGTVALSITGGRFYADSAVVRILSYLNLTELLRGAFPDPGADGLPYQSVVVRGTAQQGRLAINEAVVKSSTAHMAATGSLDLRKQAFDITVLVAPLTTVDAVVKRIPLVREILGGSLVTIPVRVTGPFDNPKVDAVPPAAVAKELGGIMERTLKLPFKIMAPVIPGGKKPKEGEGVRGPD